MSDHLLKPHNGAATFSSGGRFVAAEPGNRRRDPGSRIRTTDDFLTDTKRRRLISGARDLERNFAVASWAIRKHLDYVSTFSFQPAMADPVLNEEMQSLVQWYSRPRNCDVANRHSLRRMIRLAETRRVIDGDVFLVKLQNGRLQAVESDRVRDPDIRTGDAEDWKHGVRTGPGGSLQSIAVHSRDRYGSYNFERSIPSRNVIHLAYWNGFDQVRGISPITSAIATFQDAMEVKDYALAKAKVTQLFALAISRDAPDYLEDESELTDYQVDFGRGPVKLDLDPGDKAEFLESRHPSTEFQGFLTICLQAAIKALDIPWSFYDEGYTNFFGSKAALQNYILSCRHKREDLKEVLDRITGWRMARWVATGQLALPAGMGLEDLKWDWIPVGTPWWDPAKEVPGDLAAIEGKLMTRSEVRRMRFGDDWKQVVRGLAEEEQFMTDLGVSPAVSVAPAAEPDDEEQDE